MDGSKCILQLRGVRPFLSDKYDITKHKNYRLLSDANPKNAFRIERYLSTELKLKPDDMVEVVDCTEAVEETSDTESDDSRTSGTDEYDNDETEPEVDLEPF